jgi:ribosomal protein L12E/L44/L45/RPP1/RPP2
LKQVGSISFGGGAPAQGAPAAGSSQQAPAAAAEKKVEAPKVEEEEADFSAGGLFGDDDF